MPEEQQPASNALSPELYGLFAGSIDQMAVQRFHNAIAIASQNNVRIIHLLFQSMGGTIGDGISLYNLFRASPIEIALYNVGSVQSIATLVFLGAQRRIISNYGAFMIHRVYLNPVAATSDKLAASAGYLELEDDRVETILKTHTKLPADKWQQHKYTDVWINSKEAVNYGFADIVGEFSPPPGARLFNIWPPQN